MAHSCEAIACYDRLLTEDRYVDLVWAEALQNRMREHLLADSGRVVSSTLRPAFVEAAQLDSLACVAERLAHIIDQIRARIAETPSLLNRLQLLPAEKALAVLRPVPSCFGALFTFGFQVAEGRMFLDTVSCPDVVGLAQAWVLDRLFRQLPIMEQFTREMPSQPETLAVSLPDRSEDHRRSVKIDGMRVSLLKLSSHLAVVHNAAQGSDLAKAKLVSDLVAQNQSSVQLVAASELEYSGDTLCFKNTAISTVLRLADPKDLVIHAGLAHPLLQAYRAGAICVINNFRSEVVQRRALFELLSDASVLATIPSLDRDLLDQTVPWTRVFVPRKTAYCGQPIELIPFVLSHRTELRLCPNDILSNQPIYVGADSSPRDWAAAIQEALKGSYVVQQHVPGQAVKFPFLCYGQLDSHPVSASPQIHVVNGRSVFQSAKLQSCSRGVARAHGIAPLFAC